MEDRFLAGSGGGFICPGVDGLDVETSVDDMTVPKEVPAVIGLEANGDGIGGGVRRPGRIVDCGRFVVCDKAMIKEDDVKKIKLL